jgi:drug/metabolite transporter (DMT)-like permease
MSVDLSPTRPARSGLFADPTYLGVAAILLWSSTVAFSRRLTGDLGTWSAAALIYGGAGLLAVGAAALRRGRLQEMLRLPRAYLLGCGGLFVTYMVCLYLAVGTAANPSQVVVVGLINYLWPALSLVFSVPLLKKQAKPLLPVGIIISLGGIGLASWQPGMQPGELLNGATLWPYLLALLAAVCWGLYSNLSRRWAGESSQGATPFFLLASGLALGLGRALTPEVSHWSLQTGLELGYMMVFPAMLAYGFWDSAVRRGRIILIATLSYFTPLLSTLLTVLLLGAPAQGSLWLAAVLVLSGALVCKVSIRE